MTSIGDDAFEERNNLTIYGYTGSCAETYADGHDIPFISIGNTTTETTTTTTATTDTTTKTTTTTTSTATTTNPETPTLSKSDLDGSGSVDSTDIYYALYYVANIAVGNDGGLTPEQIAAADVDGNGSVDSTDIYYMLYYVALHGAGIHQTWEEVLAK